ncbi:hypothetical protein PBRA_004622 [Plasmodiophora brassicae]|uniref:RAP domain-containing protein n=1 Tax=Plasmodiophora brassicae TaxID=37360 RepID=A0A0G4ILF0_PLABS|nr:hypothetical protein PBRA_004622 [Plasmodiophora brassicae]
MWRRRPLLSESHFVLAVVRCSFATLINETTNVGAVLRRWQASQPKRLAMDMATLMTHCLSKQTKRASHASDLNAALWRLSCIDANEIPVRASATMLSCIAKYDRRYRCEFDRIVPLLLDSIRVGVDKPDSDCRHLANSAHSIVVLNCEGGRPVLDLIANAAERRIVEFDVTSLSTIAWAYVTSAIPSSERLLRAIARAAVPKLTESNSRSLSTLAWAFAKSGLRADTMFQAIAEASVPKLDQFSCQSLSTMVWSFATLNVPAPRLFQGVANLAARKLDDFSSLQLSNLLWAFVRANEQDEILLHSISVAVTARIHEFTPQGLYSVAWAFARYPKETSPDVFIAIAKASESMLGDFDNQQLSNLLWAIASSGVRADNLFKRALPHVSAKLSQLNSRDVSQVLWAYATVGHPKLAPLIYSATPQLMQRIPGFNMIEIAMVARALGIAHIRSDGLFAAIAQAITGKLDQCDSVGFCHIIHAFAKCDHHVDSLFSEASAVVERRCDDLSGLQLVTLMYSSVLIGRPPTELIHVLSMLHLWRLSLGKDAFERLLLSNPALVGVFDVAMSEFRTHGGDYHKQSKTAISCDVRRILKQTKFHKHFVPSFQCRQTGYCLNFAFSCSYALIGIEVNGRHHFYRDTETLKTRQRLKEHILRCHHWHVINVNFYEWDALPTDADKAQFVTDNITRVLHRVGGQSPTTDRTLAGRHAWKLHPGWVIRLCGGVAAAARPALKQRLDAGTNVMSVLMRPAAVGPHQLALLLVHSLSRQTARPGHIADLNEWVWRLHAVDIRDISFRTASTILSGLAKYDQRYLSTFECVLPMLTEAVRNTASRQDTKCRNLAAAAHALALLNCDPDRSALKALSSACQLRIDEFETKHLSIIAWAFTKLEFRDEPLFQAIARASIPQVDLFSCQSISNVVWAYAKLHIDLANLAWGFARLNARSDRLFHAISVAAVSRIDSFRSLELANIAWAFARFPVQNNVALIPAITTAALDELDDFTCQQLGQLVWATGFTQIRAVRFYEVVKSFAMARLDQFAATDLSNLLWAYGSTAQIDASALFDAAAPIISSRAHEFKPTTAASVIWSYARIERPSMTLFATFADLLSGRLHELDAKTLANIVWAFSKCGCGPSGLYDEAAAIIKQNHSGNQFTPLQLVTCMYSFALADRPPTELIDVAPHISRAFSNVHDRPLLSMLHLWRMCLPQSVIETLTASNPALQVVFDRAVDVFRSHAPDHTTALHFDVSRIIKMSRFASFAIEWAHCGTSGYLVSFALNLGSSRRVAIEVNGRQHYFPANDTRERTPKPSSRLKNRILVSCGWELIDINYDEWESMIADDKKIAFINDKIKSALGRHAQVSVQPALERTGAGTTQDLHSATCADPPADVLFEHE